MTNLTILTPISLDHVSLFSHCEVSVQQQTIPVLHYAMVDEHSRGPAYIRNQLLKRVTTEYVAMLDADDWLEPTFAEECLKYVNRGRFPIFTDWLQDGRHIKAHRRPWCNGLFHLITAVLPTDLARSVGGFDETLRGMEDTSFYLELMSRGFCGLRVPKPLVNYRKGGGRSHELHKTGEIEAIQAEINRRYGGKPMGCCGDKPPVSNEPIGKRQEGDVLAQALWGGNREEVGRATGRRYPRTSWPKTVWVDPRDIRAAPQHWQAVPEQVDMSELPEDGEDELRGVAALEAQLMTAGKLKPAPVPEVRITPVEVSVNPDFAKVKALAEQAIMGAFAIPPELLDVPISESIEPATPITITPYAKVPSVGVDNPIFVKPSRDYPSYSDFWKLVELAGFRTAYISDIDFSIASEHRRGVFVFTGPDDIPNCSAWPARTVFWQLEYVGDYTQQANIDTVDEIWSSDPEHARRTGAKYVLLGSDRRLNKHWNKVKPKAQYDIVTLAYLTDRRRVIYDQLRPHYAFAPDYPGHDGDKRHDILRRSRLMLHVHQHDTPAHTPLRYALAAAYRINMISEATSHNAPFLGDIIWSEYEDLAEVTQQYLDGEGFDMPAKYKSGEMLYHHLCITNPFEKCVREALNA